MAIVTICLNPHFLVSFPTFFMPVDSIWSPEGDSERIAESLALKPSRCTLVSCHLLWPSYSMREKISPISLSCCHSTAQKQKISPVQGILISLVWLVGRLRGLLGLRGDTGAICRTCILKGLVSHIMDLGPFSC